MKWIIRIEIAMEIPCPHYGENAFMADLSTSEIMLCEMEGTKKEMLNHVPEFYSHMGEKKVFGVHFYPLP